MRAHELAVEFPTVTPDTGALEAARLLAEHHLPGLIVIDADHRPVAVLSAPQLLGAVIPGYVRDDPALARVYDEGHADQLCAPLAAKTVADLLPSDHTAPPVVDAHATAMEIASLMAQARSSVVAVSADPHRTDAPMTGVVTASDLLARLLSAGAPQTT
ncbi:CBS domain-containing protein [Actinomadura darangshiensis]|uniref:CBS domain-containing protein n=1 Tax=Actinomadura darangshiensis TaxID=705336 RepID=A0A4V2YW88_9ACTN|nr:CBS domain-containing protein [Actinomadura darangshiensis]TDD84397.1 CBS domain-containing protein [Actinomadura darangshiensis]